jgi:hypothetical protein
MPCGGRGRRKSLRSENLARKTLTRASDFGLILTILGQRRVRCFVGRGQGLGGEGREWIADACRLPERREDAVSLQGPDALGLSVPLGRI